MANIELEDLGNVDVGRRLEANINISAEELFEKFAIAAEKLSSDAIDKIRSAINDDDRPRTRGERDEIENFFEEVKSQLGTLGFGEEEADELEEAEDLEGEQMDEAEVDYESGEETYDETTGQSEGTIILDDSKTDDTKLVPVIIQEKFEGNYEHDGLPIMEQTALTGLLKLENISENDRLWDLDVHLENIGQTSIEDEAISIKELEPEQPYEQEYEITADIEPELTIKEFISTVNDPDMECYSLAVNAENEVYIKVQLTNISENDLTKIQLRKELPSNFENVEISDQSMGEANIESSEEEFDEDSEVLVWDIESLEANEEANVEIRFSITVEDQEAAIRSGLINVNYSSPQTLSRITIDRFNAYTNHAFAIITREHEQNPNSFECQFMFVNKSDYMIRLVNADVYNPEDPSTKFVDIDPNEVPEIPAGGKWQSTVWEYTSQEEGEYPTFKAKVDFHAVSDHQISTLYKMKYSDISLAVVAVDGSLEYDIEQIPSFKITPFNLTGIITNTGGAEIDEVILRETVQPEFLPPKPEEVKVLVNGYEISVPDEAISIEPEDNDITNEHTISVNLINLRETERGALQPRDEITITYPITAHKPHSDTIYHADAKITANTYPRGKPVEIEVEPIEINVVHIRHSIANYKETKALANEGEYEVTLIVENIGEHTFENYVLTEKIDLEKELYDVSGDPEIVEQGDVRVLTWNITEIPAGDSVEVTYKFNAQGETVTSEYE
jgi:hypothetical protein